MPLTSKLRNTSKPIAKAVSKEPVWKGPEIDGVTQSLLSRFLSCRERFRILVVEGLKPADHFEPRIEFGSMWHAAEEEFARTNGSDDNWYRALVDYAKGLCKKYKLQQEQVQHWFNIAKTMFPLYIDHWKENDDVVDRTPLLQEQEFRVPYQLPSGRKVTLRGKFDAVDLIGKGKSAGIYLFETKTKSSVDAIKLQRQLAFDLQTQMYLVALSCCGSGDGGGTAAWNTARRVIDKHLKYGPVDVKGVRYNVIRRSAHKSVESMLKKLTEDRENGRIGEWFGRWKVEVTSGDIQRFRRECLDPILEQLCNWWDWVTKHKGYPWTYEGQHGPHWRTPYLGYNPLEDGGFGDVDSYMDTGSEVGLHRVDNLFPELTNP